VKGPKPFIGGISALAAVIITGDSRDESGIRSLNNFAFVTTNYRFGVGYNGRGIGRSNPTPRPIR
jgi:hypothetical protein